MQEKLDYHFNGENAFLEVQRRESSKKRQEKRQRARRNLEKKKALKDQLNLEEPNNMNTEDGEYDTDTDGDVSESDAEISDSVSKDSEHAQRSETVTKS